MSTLYKWITCEVTLKFKMNHNIWDEVIDALSRIVKVYERGSTAFGLFQDWSVRFKGLVELLGNSSDNLCIIDLGAGPGTLEEVLSRHSKLTVHFDILPQMSLYAKTTHKHLQNVEYVIGVFEHLPFRRKAFDAAISSFSFRDARDKILALREVARVVKNRYVVIDIGKPDNRVIELFELIYLKYLVPLITSIVVGSRFWRFWKVLYKTFQQLPRNRELNSMFRKFFKNVVMYKFIFGGAIVIKAEKPVC